MGTSSESPIHFVGDPCSRVVYVTEGLLKLGDILAFAREAVNGPKIEHLSLCVIDGKERLPDVWYDDNFKECEAA